MLSVHPGLNSAEHRTQTTASSVHCQFQLKSGKGEQTTKEAPTRRNSKHFEFECILSPKGKKTLTFHQPLDSSSRSLLSKVCSYLQHNTPRFPHLQALSPFHSEQPHWPHCALLSFPFHSLIFSFCLHADCPHTLPLLILLHILIAIIRHVVFYPKKCRRHDYDISQASSRSKCFGGDFTRFG